ncbi:hypothetical protein M405DRAFT_886221 [Rhizopogon salebrosus TDB-379]|nr:hypothetical protein M405DRAFT_886221 [Rhizopogon salebrosus TDB-379]
MCNVYNILHGPTMGWPIWQARLSPRLTCLTWTKSLNGLNGPAHKCMWPFPSPLGLSHHHLVFPCMWAFPITTWSFPLPSGLSLPSHKCMWAFPITIWSFPMSAKSANGPSHQFIWVFPIIRGVQSWISNLIWTWIWMWIWNLQNEISFGIQIMDFGCTIWQRSAGSYLLLAESRSVVHYTMSKSKRSATQKAAKPVVVKAHKKKPTVVPRLDAGDSDSDKENAADAGGISDAKKMWCGKQSIAGQVFPCFTNLLRPCPSTPCTLWSSFHPSDHFLCNPITPMAPGAPWGIIPAVQTIMQCSGTS